MADGSSLSDLDLLFKRLSVLETKVYGKYGEMETVPINVIESLQSVNSKLNHALTGRERTKSLLKRMDEIQRYLNPNVGTNALLEDKVKMNIILNEEQHIQGMVSQLQAIQAMKFVLDSEHIKAVPSHVDNLTSLSRSQLQQEDNVASLAVEIQHLVDNYNSLIATLSQLFVQWDELVTKLEIAALPMKKL